MIDARWFVLANNSALLALGLWRFGLQRSPGQIAFCFATGIAAELLGWRLSHKNRASPLGDRLLSGSVACVSTLILLRAPDWWFYGLVASVGLLSKYIIVDERGRHIFNPTNFAIVAALALLPDRLFVRPDQFSAELWPQLMIVSFGALAIVFGARWRATLGYFATVLVVGVPLGGWLLNVRPMWVLAPEANASTLIFAFLMIPDPKTTPSHPLGQLAFGAGVACVHLVMRATQIPYSPFVALFVVTGVRSLWRPRPARAQHQMV